MNERQMIQDLVGQLNRILDSCDGTAGGVAVAALMTAARYARRAEIPAVVAAAIVADYIARGDPV